MGRKTSRLTPTHHPRSRHGPYQRGFGSRDTSTTEQGNETMSMALEFIKEGSAFPKRESKRGEIWVEQYTREAGFKQAGNGHRDLVKKSFWGFKVKFEGHPAEWQFYGPRFNGAGLTKKTALAKVKEFLNWKDITIMLDGVPAELADPFNESGWKR